MIDTEFALTKSKTQINRQKDLTYLYKEKLKTIFLLFVLLSANWGLSQQHVSNTKTYKNNRENLKEDSTCFVVADIEKIDSLIQISQKKYKIVYLFSDKCHSSLESFPVLIEYIDKHSEKFELFPIIGYRYSEIPRIKKYFDHMHYSNPVYIMDIVKYGNKKNPFKRLDKMIKGLCKECDFKKMGFSSFFVFDESNKIVLHNTWEVVGLEKLDQLKKLPL